MRPKEDPSRKAQGSPTSRITAAAAMATGRVRAPDAKGRCFLTGWRRSFSMSARSLIRYMALDRAQKMMNAAMLRPKSGRSVIRPSKNMPAKTKTFFAHCLGRIARSKALGTVSPPISNWTNHRRNGRRRQRGHILLVLGADQSDRPCGRHCQRGLGPYWRKRERHAVL